MYCFFLLKIDPDATAQRAKDPGFHIVLVEGWEHAERGVLVFPLFTVVAKLFHRPLDVSWGPTQRASGGILGTQGDTCRVEVTFISTRVFKMHEKPDKMTHFHSEYCFPPNQNAF